MIVCLIFLAVIMPSPVALSTVSAVPHNTIRTPISGMIKLFEAKSLPSGVIIRWIGLTLHKFKQGVMTKW